MSGDDNDNDVNHNDLDREDRPAQPRGRGRPSVAYGLRRVAALRGVLKRMEQWRPSASNEAVERALVRDMRYACGSTATGGALISVDAALAMLPPDWLFIFSDDHEDGAFIAHCSLRDLGGHYHSGHAPDRAVAIRIALLRGQLSELLKQTSETGP